MEDFWGRGTGCPPDPRPPLTWGTRSLVALLSDRPAKLQPSLKISDWMVGVCKVKLLPPKLAFNSLHSRPRMRLRARELTRVRSGLEGGS